MSLSKYVYYLLQWELRLFTENVSDVSKGDNKKVFSETEGYESVWFWSVFPLPFKKEKKTGLFRKIRFPPLKFIRKLQRTCMEKGMKYTSWIELVLRETEDES